MKKIFILSLVTLFVALSGATVTSAQFPLKMPKLPKAEKPKQEPSKTSGSGGTAQSREAVTETEQPKNSNSKRIYGPELAPNAPRFIPDSVSLKASTTGTYWKMPKQNDYTSWIPVVRFNIFYDVQSRASSLAYTAEYTNPDGSAWFSEDLEISNPDAAGLIAVGSNRDITYKMLETKASVGTGVYNVKITSKDAGETIFQGKFKVAKFLRPYSERTPNRFDFFVEHDWHLTIGYVGFHFSSFQSPRVNETGGFPVIVSTWLRGDVSANDLEARLFYKGEQIAIKQGGSSDGRFWAEKASEFAATAPNPPIWKLWNFQWETFRFANGGNFNCDNYPNALYADENPGEYTVKIFLKGTQVRELKFTVQPDGRLADGGFSKQIYLPFHKVIVPVKVMGNLEKWNAAAWKTDLFYGNPLAGFTVQ